MRKKIDMVVTVLGALAMLCCQWCGVVGWIRSKDG